MYSTGQGVSFAVAELFPTVKEMTGMLITHEYRLFPHAVVQKTEIVNYY